MALTTEKSFPFDAKNVNGEYDRTYVADDFARYFRAFISSGVFMGESTNLQVIANGDMTVTLKKGDIIIDGYRYELQEDTTIALTAADGNLSRIDRISATWSQEDRDIHFVVREGSASYNPVAPECRRSADYKDYVVADILIGAGVISITQANITDQRLNAEVCGMATPFDKVDTTTIFNQFQAWFNEVKAAGNTDIQGLIDSYEAWINSTETEEKAKAEALLQEMQDILDDSAAGHLQLEIDDIVSKNESQDNEIAMLFYGFATKKTVFNADGSITETDSKGNTKTTVFNTDGSITETVTNDKSTSTIATKTTTFNADGSITEVVSK